MKSALSGKSNLSEVHEMISFFDDEIVSKAAVDYLGHEPESYLICGFPGSGKSTLLRTFPDWYILNADRKTAGVKAGSKIKTFRHGEDVYNQTIDILDAMSDLEVVKKMGVKTVCIDTISALSELIEVFCVKDPTLNPKKTSGLQIQHYSIIQHAIVEIIRRCYETGLDIVITAHPDEIQSEEGELVYHPAVTGKKGGPKLGGKFDNVIWMERKDSVFSAVLKGTTKFPHAKLAVSPFINKTIPTRIKDLTYKKLCAVKSGKIKVKEK